MSFPFSRRQIVCAYIFCALSGSMLPFVPSPASAALKSGPTTSTKPAVGGAVPTKPSASPTTGTNVKAEVERKLVALQQQASPGLVVGKATCPAALASVQSSAKKTASKPATYQCTVVVEGVGAPYNVEIRDGGFVQGGTFLMSRAKAILDIAKIVEGVRQQLDAADRSTARVECGRAKVVVAVVGDEISCTVVYPSGTGNQLLKFIVRDLDGTVALQV